MTISNIYVGFLLFLCVMVVTFMFGWLSAFIWDNNYMTTFWAWMIASLGLSVCLVIIFVQNNII